MLTADEQNVVAEIRRLMKSESGWNINPIFPPWCVANLLAIIDRLTALANEGLTEEEQHELDQAVNHSYWSKPAHWLRDAIRKLQAQVAMNAGIASDALVDRGLERLAEVEKRVAGECAAICSSVEKVQGYYDGSATAGAAAYQIRRRFGLPTTIDTRHDTSQPDYEWHAREGRTSSDIHLCTGCGGNGRIAFMADEDIDCPSCHGTGLEERTL